MKEYIVCSLLETCTACNGRGFVIELEAHYCQECNGLGTLRREVPLEDALRDLGMLAPAASEAPENFGWTLEKYDTTAEKTHPAAAPEEESPAQQGAQGRQKQMLLHLGVAVALLLTAACVLLASFEKTPADSRLPVPLAAAPPLFQGRETIAATPQPPEILPALPVLLPALPLLDSSPRRNGELKIWTLTHGWLVWRDGIAFVPKP
jgi:hypothetical protein